MNSSQPIKVLVADDSVFMRMFIKEILEKDKSILVTAQARDGREASEMCRAQRPAVVLLDLNMGEFDGLYAVKKIMEQCPTPIVILSAIGNTNMDPVFAALDAGALDYLNKPSKENGDMRSVEKTLIEKVREAAQVHMHPVARTEKKINTNPHSFGDELIYDAIVIGASTGGPTAVEKVIANLPANLAVPVLIAQHMPSNFVPSFVNRLNGLTPLEVSLARKDSPVEKGKIIVAPGSRNIIVRRSNEGVYIDYSSKRFKDFNFPSVNCLMLSVAEVYGGKSIGVILTGMGKDGVTGMRAIFDAGGYTIAQSEASCVVYGMPRAAIEEGCIRQIVPLDEIGAFLVGCLS